MSYIQFQQRCEDCKKEWNAAFGMINNIQITVSPSSCPYCGSVHLIKIADNWKINEVGIDSRPVCPCGCHRDEVKHALPCCGTKESNFEFKPPFDTQHNIANRWFG